MEERLLLESFWTFVNPNPDAPRYEFSRMGFVIEMLLRCEKDEDGVYVNVSARMSQNKHYLFERCLSIMMDQEIKEVPFLRCDTPLDELIKEEFGLPITPDEITRGMFALWFAVRTMFGRMWSWYSFLVLDNPTDCFTTETGESGTNIMRDLFASMVEANEDELIPTGKTLKDYLDEVDLENEVIELGNEVTFTVQDVSFKMILVEGGNFYMGAERGERIIEEGSNWSKIRIDSTVQNYDEEADDNESPVHLEHLNDYYIGETQVTQELWQAVMGNNPSLFKGADKPVENVSWDECQEFIKKLNSFFPDRPFFCLPTEAEWEYAARGGVKSQYLKYAGCNKLDEVAWYWRNSGDSYLPGPDMDGNAEKNKQDLEKNHCCTHRVKGKCPNELGLYDMSGNVMEWCQSKYSIYGRNPDKNADRVLRGGCWSSYSIYCRVTERDYTFAKHKGPDCGFRLAWHIDLSVFR